MKKKTPQILVQRKVYLKKDCMILQFRSSDNNPKQNLTFCVQSLITIKWTSSSAKWTGLGPPYTIPW